MERLVNQLKQLGLTEYEARAYISLAELGPSSPRDVARRARIPYPSAYDALKALVSKGWAEAAASRPTIYTPRSPAAIGTETIAGLRRAFEQLESIYRDVSSRTPRAEIIYTVMGKDRVLKKIFEMLDRARKDVILVLPWNSPMSGSVIRRLRDLEQRKVEVKLMTDNGEAHLSVGKVRFRKPVHAIDLLVDGSEALIGLLDYSACGWVENRFIAAHFREFLNLMWNSSRPL